jgi:lipopolysaccharide assembly protein A
MRYVVSILKIVLFALALTFALTFAVKNTDPVSVRYFLGREWRAPLVVILLVFFCVGAALGVLSTLGQVLRQRREISTLRRELSGSAGARGAQGTAASGLEST